MKNLKFFLSIFVLIFAMSIPMSAGFVQAWAFDTNNVDKLEAFMVTPPGGFSNPALTALPVGWTSNNVNPNYVLATGSAVSASTGYNINFDVNGPLQLDVIEWNGTNMQEHLRFYYGYAYTDTTYYNGSYGAWQWHQPDGSYVDSQLGNNYDRSPVPEPGTYLSLGAGLIGLVAWRRRQLNR